MYILLLFVDTLRINTTIVAAASTAITSVTVADITTTATTTTAAASAVPVNLHPSKRTPEDGGAEKQNSAARFSVESNSQLSRRGRKPFSYTTGVTKQLICCGIIRSVGCGRDWV
jgi:hypothetical protein